MFNKFSGILYITFDARGVLSLMRILRGGSEVKRMTQMLPITLQGRHISKMLRHMLNKQATFAWTELAAALNFHTEYAARRRTHPRLNLSLLRITSEV